ncbi:olfactory receptor 52R1-like protein [Cricetulus griseus]|uniref:Olfactory receptor n=1 Tax=Cricetulus griseus TaxID=10029 RepID=A0A061IG11_CRIGR|nr:olfactory receptor 52R1-like protein [Cricetulus griseus]
MVTSRNDTSHPLFFILLGIPGLENYQFWIAFPFCVMYIVALVGNVIILHIIRIDHTLHEPMYLFLALLAITDLVLSSSTQPKMLAILWFHDHKIEYHACLIQVFFIHAFSSVESGVLMAMALDRYVAICFPLRHSSILTTSVVIKLGAAVMVRGLLWVSPFCFMISRMPFCPNKVIPQSYCEHMAVLKLVCADIRINRGYGLFVAFSVASFDIIVISLSYVMILKAVLRLPSGEARLKAFGTCASHIGVPNKVIPQSYCEHMAVLKLVCADTRVNRGYGLFVAFSVVGFDIIVISVSYVMILRAVLRLPPGEARLKAFGTCASHVCVILAFYIPALFTFLTHRFGHHVPRVVHIMFANVYLLVPPMLNPIIYGVRTKQIRDRVTRGVCRKDP